jgi:hypothetical protein
MCANVMKVKLSGFAGVSVGNPSRLLLDLRIGDGRRTDVEEHLDRCHETAVARRWSWGIWISNILVVHASK